MLHHRKQEFIDTWVSYTGSLKFFCFGAVSISQICFGTCQAVDEGISETTNLKKILETSYRKMLSQIYQNFDISNVYVLSLTNCYSVFNYGYT